MFRNMTLTVWALVLLMPMTAMAEEVVFDRIVAKINDEIITQYDLEEEMKPIYAQIGNRQLNDREKDQLAKLRKQTLERMVNDALLAQEIEKYGVVVSDDVIDKEIEKVKEERGLTDDEFLEMLKKDGVNLSEFRQKLKLIIEKQELLGYMVHSKVLVTDSEIEAEYKARRDDYVLEKLVSLAIIMLPSDVAPLEVKKRIEDGEMTFAEAAAKYSIGPNKDEGGSIGEVEWGDLADDWKDSIEGVSEGGVSSPVTVQGKESLLSPVKIVEDRLVPLEEVRDDLFKQLTEEKRNKIFEEYFDKLKQSSVIEYMD
ncbi:SurA N-terminal domain-containing protein [Pseudodesulfovibrio sp. zrk46]|uniref:SurA N-terminal domain-containing protein n=1 Tax=Pseudodesulfovibrio sp. zrk46 TaxID=2725288 RepID=UPI001FFCDE84|nr:SurA N-terminal domain-containing protein [Pseudodesulfovibrio sp. zrk46]